MSDSMIKILLGVLQGLTEFLPVSSSGHLVLFLNLSSWPQEKILPMVIWLHLATTLAVIIFFRRELLDMAAGLFGGCQPKQREGCKLVFLVIVGTLATAFLALPFKNFFESLFSSPKSVSLGLLLTGLALLLSDRMDNPEGGLEKFHFWKAAVIGLAQGLAIAPGISRSGATITAALFLGISREWAFSFSFILAIPAIIAATVLEGPSFDALGSGDMLLYLEVMAAAFISGYVALALLSRWVKRRRLFIFSIYCWLLATFITFYIP